MDGMTRRARNIVVATLGAAGTTGCFASVGQLDELREDMNVVRAEAAAADSVRSRQLLQIIGTIRTLNDTLAAFNNRLSRVRAESQGEIRGLRQDVLHVQEVNGQSQQRLQEMRTALEQRDRQQQPVARPLASPRAPADSTPLPARVTESDGPGPNELLQLGRDQLASGGHSAARAAFTDLLKRFPDSDVAPDAQFFLGEAYAAEKKTAAADSAYAVVGVKYPNSGRAPIALYKRAVMAQAARRTTAARRLFNELIDRYPASDEAELARERMRILS